MLVERRGERRPSQWQYTVVVHDDDVGINLRLKCAKPNRRWCRRNQSERTFEAQPYAPKADSNARRKSSIFNVFVSMTSGHRVESC